MSLPLDPITEAVLEFIGTGTWAESKLVLEKHRDLLLTDAADAVLAQYLDRYRGDTDATRVIADHRMLLVRCRQEGIDAVYAERLHASAEQREREIRTLLDELSRLITPNDVPRAITVSRAALELVDIRDEPELWGTLQSKLGTYLSTDLLGNREENLEQSIEHYEEALKVFTRQDFPERWARVQHNQMLSYSQRIRGDSAANLEHAIDNAKLALEVRTSREFPEQ
jgi:hypothetical protein